MSKNYWMCAGSWQSPGVTLIPLCPVWGRKDSAKSVIWLLQITSSRPFATVPSSGPQPLFLVTLGRDKPRSLLLPSTILPPGTGHHQQRWPRDRSTGCGGSPSFLPPPRHFLPAVQGHPLHLPDLCQAVPKGTAA